MYTLNEPVGYVLLGVVILDIYKVNMFRVYCVYVVSVGLKIFLNSKTFVDFKETSSFASSKPSEYEYLIVLSVDAKDKSFGS